MTQTIINELSTYNKWKNIEYDFSGHSNNCTLNVQVENLVIDYKVKLNFNYQIMLLSD